MVDATVDGGPDVPVPVVPVVPDVLVWEAAGRVVGRHGYGRAIARRLRAAGRTVVVVPLVERVPTATEVMARHHVVSGGETSVHADDAWLAAARRVLAPVIDRALSGRATVTGVCFGSQLLATMIAGARAVAPHPAGMQAGLVDAVDHRSGTSHVVSSFHYHHVDGAVIGRAGAEIVIGSASTPVQAFELGGVRGVQFHPELAPGQLRRALAGHAAVVARYGACPERAAVAIAQRRSRWTTELWNRFVAQVPAPALVPTHRGAVAMAS